MRKIIFTFTSALISITVHAQTLDTTFGLQGVRDLQAQSISYYTKSPICINDNGNILTANFFTGASCLDSNGQFVSNFSYNEVDGNTTVIRKYPDNKYIIGTNFSIMTGAYIKRLKSNGALDSTFGNMGIIQLNGEVHDILVNNDSTIIVASRSFSPYGINITKFLSNGIIDNTFGTGGVTTSNDFNYLQNFNLNADIKHSITLSGDANNNYYLGGMDSNNARIIKLFSSGQIDNSFNFNYNIGFDDEVRRILYFNNSLYAVCGKFSGAQFNCNDTIQDIWSIIKFNSNGGLDLTYGQNGIFIDTNAINGPLANAFIDNSGIILIGADNDNSSLHIFKGIRIKNNATVDTNWHFQKSVGDCSTITGAEQQSNGKIVITSAYEMPVAIYGCVALRYNNTSTCTQATSPHPIIVFNGTILTCTNVSNIQAFEWTYNNNIVSNTFSFQPTQNGTYIVKSIDSNGCFGLDTFIVTTVNTNDFTEKEVEWYFYPNPSTNEIYIHNVTNDNNLQKFEIYNFLGQIIYQKEILPSISKFSINISTFPTGVYFIKYKNISHKLIKSNAQ